MKKVNIGIFCSLLLALGFTSCTSEGESKLMLNEVLVDNQTNFQDDYGVHSAWIEIFNKSYGSADLAGCYLKHSSQPGDTAVYFIPKGDVLTGNGQGQLDRPVRFGQKETGRNRHSRRTAASRPVVRTCGRCSG